MESKKIVVKGITLEGNTFRPSDWIDRLCSIASTFNSNHRLVYSDYLYPVMIDDKRCLLINEELSQFSPEIYNHVMDFISLNRLVCIDDKEL